MTSWLNDQFAKRQVDKMTSLQNDQLTYCQVAVIAS